MGFALRDGKENGEHDGGEFVEVSMISLMQDIFFSEMDPFDRA